ncbi:MAG: DUF721 domain-containing protein [Gammaproteobacteria bacterium]|nr:DUF721 domain-containing protein [Gammaproteobacteria bacterium]
MKKNYPKSLKSLMSDRSGTLNTLIQRAQSLQQMTEALHLCLPTPAHAHCVAANYQKRTLILLCDTPAWTSKIRYHSPVILKHMRQQLRGLQSVRIKTRPRQTPLPVRQRLRRARCSVATSRIISRGAQSIHDEALRTALLRLAERVSCAATSRR